jgi:hypothetical protein
VKWRRHTKWRSDGHRRRVDLRPQLKALLKGSRSHRQPCLYRREAADRFRGKTTAPNQLWQTDVTCFKVIRAERNLATLLDGYSRSIIARKLCARGRCRVTRLGLERLGLSVMRRGPFGLPVRLQSRRRLSQRSRPTLGSARGDEINSNVTKSTTATAEANPKSAERRIERMRDRSSTSRDTQKET